MTTQPLLLAAALLTSTASLAIAQQPATYDPSRVPVISGTVSEYSLTPRGDVDGLILTNGTQVHLPVHLGRQLVTIVKPGDAVEVRGLEAQALPVVQAISVTSTASGAAVVDTGPRPTPPAPVANPAQWMTVQGVVREPLYGPLGDLNGALLADGTQVHLPPDQGAALTQNLQAGKPLVAEGYGVSGPYGRALDAQRIGTSAATLVTVSAIAPAPGPDAGPPPPAPPGPPPPAPPAAGAPASP
ncbi:hypothetical protein [Acidisoma sp. 7E03]